jgi:hypothetical protein
MWEARVFAVIDGEYVPVLDAQAQTTGTPNQPPASAPGSLPAIAGRCLVKEASIQVT